MNPVVPIVLRSRGVQIIYIHIRKKTALPFCIIEFLSHHDGNKLFRFDNTKLFDKTADPFIHNFNRIIHLYAPPNTE